MLLKDKVAIITGAGRGIGLAIAKKLAKEGAKIALLDVNENLLEEAKKELEKQNAEIRALVGDVTQFEQIQSVIKEIKKNWGHIDILVNNAGVTRDGPLIRMDEEAWDFVLNINLKGVFNCTKAVARLMMKQRSGKIINVASVVGVMGNAMQSNYASSKAGVIGFTKSIAKELASRNINVNAIAPGFIQTAMTDKLSEEIKEEYIKHIPLGRLGTPDEIADIVLFLSSPMANYITGQVIVIDGGMYI